jgi:hypothetical protein
MADTDEGLAARYAKEEAGALISLALQPGDLTPAARKALSVELKKRGLVPALQPALDEKLNTPSEQEQAELVRFVQGLPCPICGERRGPLSAFIIERGAPFGSPFGIAKTVELLVGCEPCLDRKGDASEHEFERFVERQGPLFQILRHRPEALQLVLAQRWGDLLALLGSPSVPDAASAVPVEVSGTVEPEYERVPVAPKRSSGTRIVLVFAAIVVAFVGGIVAFARHSTAPLGAPCTSDGDCRSGYCGEAYADHGICTQKCTPPTGCPAGFECREQDRLCMPDGNLGFGEPCVADFQCGSRDCWRGHDTGSYCSQPCDVARTCPVSARCVDGYCVK